MMTLLKEIQSQYYSFSDKEKNVADYLLAEPLKSSRSNIKQIAEKTDVSVSTITRFCRKVSCKNFAELKVKLAGEADTRESTTLDKQIKNQYINIFHDIQGLNNNESVENTLNILENARRIYVYGVGSSGLAATELNYRLSRMGFISEAVTDPHLMIIRSTLVNDNDVIVAFSRSGQTKELITAVSKAKNKKTSLISITAYDNTSLTKLSDEVLWTIHPGRHSYLSTGLDLSALYLIDLISMHFLQEPARKEIYNDTISVISSEVHI